MILRHGCSGGLQETTRTEVRTHLALRGGQEDVIGLGLSSRLLGCDVVSSLTNQKSVLLFIDQLEASITWDTGLGPTPALMMVVLLRVEEGVTVVAVETMTVPPDQ